MQSIRTRVTFSKHNYLPFFIDFFTSNMTISPVFGRRLISTSFPRDRISRIILISFSPMLLFYHIFHMRLSPHFAILRIHSHYTIAHYHRFLSPHKSAKAAGFPAAMLIFTFLKLLFSFEFSFFACAIFGNHTLFFISSIPSSR